MAAAHVPEDVTSAVCKICLKKKGIYVCPRCNILYCSLPCYQSELHVNCSEAFYRDCVMENMSCLEKAPLADKKMNEIWHWLQCREENNNINDSDDDDSIPDLEERFRGVDLNDPDSVWKKLTPAERQEFEELLQSGDISQFVVPWQPWWLYRKQKILVQDMENDQDPVHPAYEANCPVVKEDVPPLTQISKTPPAHCVKYNVLNVLGAYCYTVRYFNGEHRDMPVEASSVLVKLSGNLSLNHTYNSAVTAIDAVAHEAVNWMSLDEAHGSVMCLKEDVECIVAGPEDRNTTFYVQASLSDIHRLLSEAKHSQKTGPKAVKTKKMEFSKRFLGLSSPSFVPRDRLQRLIKKLEYYLSWAQDHAREIHYQTT